MSALNFDFERESDWLKVSSGLQDSPKCPGRFRTAVIWIVFVFTLIFSPSLRHFSRFLRIAPRAPTIIIISLLTSFSHQCYQEVSHGNLIFYCSILFPSLLGTVTSAPATIRITVTFMFYSWFLLGFILWGVLWQGPSICLSFRFLYFHFVIRWNGKIHLMTTHQE